MHTFEITRRITPSAYCYLCKNLPNLSTVNDFVKRTNYYSAKGITQIELKIHQYRKCGVLIERYYLTLRCNPSIIMGDSKYLLINMDIYTTDEIMKRIIKRIYEINEFRYIHLHMYPITDFKTSRADIAIDIMTQNPEIIIWICNMSFPYKHLQMTPAHINKSKDILYYESCCFSNESRGFNIYFKWAGILNSNKQNNVPVKELIQLKHTVRIELQLKKNYIKYIASKLPAKRSIESFLKKEFCNALIKDEIDSVFGSLKYVCRSKATKIINMSSYKPYQKAVMISIVDMIQNLNGIYTLEEAIYNDKIITPSHYGNLRSFRECWISKFKTLGISPVVLPDTLGIEEIPSISTLLTQNNLDNTKSIS